MKPSSGTLALFSIALCLAVHAQNAVTPSPSGSASPAAPSASSTTAATTTVGLSDIRIVRLSQVRGKVDIDRHIGRGYEEAFANIPITGGTKLRTEVGLAEVEFEDNSTLRLTPDTDVDFALLKRTAAGSTVNSVNVVKGMVYASLANTKGNTFTIAAGNTSVQLNPSSHIRLMVDGANSNIAVLEGTVQFTDGSSVTTLTRNKSFGFDVSGADPPAQVKFAESAFDQWDKNGVDYQKQYSSLRTSGGAGLYGSSDLNYYGSFANMGCGSMWRPYFASAAWSPYDNGVWAYYPNAGYSWVSPYPWGWLPFHSGNWISCGGAGWGWQPGGQFVGLQNMATTAAPAAAAGRALPVAPAPPRPGAPAMVPVNARPLAISSISAPGTFTFRNDSAGLGVPREGFGDLRYISSDVAHHGEIHTDIERSFIGPSMSNGNRGASNRELSPASRSVATFSHPGADVRGNGAGDMSSGWSGSARDSMRGSDSASPASARRSVEAASTSPSSSNSSTSTSGGSHK